MIAKKKRRWVYVMRPAAYELSGCPSCGNSDPEWSEWQGHLWCAHCQKDFVPAFNGMFDGPIPVQAAALMGISFGRRSIRTGMIIREPAGK